MALGDKELVRYSRQILLAQVGGRGQARLLSARVAVDGGGGAAQSASEYLRASGTAAPGAGEEGHRVHVSAGGIAVLAPGGCGRCYQAHVQGRRSSDSVALGALAALVVQRELLGLGPAPQDAPGLVGHDLAGADPLALQLVPSAKVQCPHR